MFIYIQPGQVELEKLLADPTIEDGKFGGFQSN